MEVVEEVQQCFAPFAPLFSYIVSTASAEVVS
jgi:hypothetical protein